MQVYRSKHCNPDFDESFVHDTLALATNALAIENLTLNGRGEVFIRDDCSPNVIVRRYRRGGLVGKLISHLYFHNPLNRLRGKSEPSFRMVRELELLDHMISLNLPCPKPVAVAVGLHTLSYEGYLLTEFIPESNTLASLLLGENPGLEVWQGIGSTIRSFHDHQIYHSDLNATNILLDANQNIYLIDFDKCHVKAGDDWKQANLERLLKSLKKLSANHTPFNFDNQMWQQLMSGYKKQESTALP